MKFRKKSLPKAGVDMTPMIDIVFLLIIFFMVSSTFIKNRGIKVSLPKSATSQSQSDNKIIISIKKNGEIYLNNQIITGNLNEMLRNERLKNGNDVIIIKGDKEVSYKKMIEVMDSAKAVGLDRIILATTKR